RIYINFCNPWPKERHKKRRLTHNRQLEKYKTFLRPEGEIWFKTDDDPLFEESLEYFKESGFNIEYITYDLHKSGFKGNVVTEHEKMFTGMGIKTKFLIAKQQ
ncbi:MAG: tRNA (guanosine(46)-N7)-methyltransferase TrmB, partial [Clostridium sp.]